MRRRLHAFLHIAPKISNISLTPHPYMVHGGAWCGRQSAPKMQDARCSVWPPTSYVWSALDRAVPHARRNGHHETKVKLAYSFPQLICTAQPTKRAHDAFDAHIQAHKRVLTRQETSARKVCGWSCEACTFDAAAEDGDVNTMMANDCPAIISKGMHPADLR